MSGAVIARLRLLRSAREALLLAAMAAGESFTGNNHGLAILHAAIGLLRLAQADDDGRARDVAEAILRDLRRRA